MGALPRTMVVKLAAALSMPWIAELVSASEMGGGKASKMGWGIGRVESVRGVGTEVDGEELCGRGRSTATGDSRGLYVGGPIVGDLVFLRDRGPRIDRAGGIL